MRTSDINRKQPNIKKLRHHRLDEAILYSLKMLNGQRTKDLREGSPPGKKRKTDYDKIEEPSSEISVVPKTAPEDDWQVNKPLSACLDYLLEKSHLTDVTFEFPNEGSDVRLEAHKLILAARSPVFEAMFYGLAGKQDEGPVQITDASSKTYEEMLKFIHTDTVPMTDITDVINLLQLSHKYRLDSLLNACCDYLESNLNTDDVLTILEVAMFLELSTLKTRCLIYMDVEDFKFWTTESFKCIKQDTLLEIVKRDTLPIPENVIYHCCVDWADKECIRQNIPSTGENKRVVLGPVLQQIRFTLISAEDIADEVVQDEVLTDRQLVDLFKRKNGKTRPDFPDNPLKRFSIEEIILHSGTPNKSEAFPIVRQETVKITVTEDLLLSTLIYRKIQARHHVTHTSMRANTVKGEIKTVSEDGNEVDSCSAFRLHAWDDYTVEVELKKSIVLKKDVIYKVCIDLIFTNSHVRHTYRAASPLALPGYKASVNWSSEHGSSVKSVNSVLFYPWV